MSVFTRKTCSPIHTDSILGINRVTSRDEDFTSIERINYVTQREALESGNSRSGYDSFRSSAAAPEYASAKQHASASGYDSSRDSASSAHVSTGYRAMPSLINQTRKGQKTLLGDAHSLGTIKACLGWNVSNPACDVDVSAFILGRDGKVLGDDWFVFYGQKESPDHRVIFSDHEPDDRESVTVDLTQLNPDTARIVFVLTINDALLHHLNFSMLKDAYVRILDASSGRELVSFVMDDYYSNVISMMIGEIYLHNGSWKFNAIGNGVAKDLKGLCTLYGVQVV